MFRDHKVFRARKVPRAYRELRVLPEQLAHRVVQEQPVPRVRKVSRESPVHKAFKE